jgi:hypothetical protein
LQQGGHRDREYLRERTDQREETPDNSLRIPNEVNIKTGVLDICRENLQNLPPVGGELGLGVLCHRTFLFVS